MQIRSKVIASSVVVFASALAGCATESSQALSVPTPVPVQASSAQSLIKVSVGKFDNRSTYMRGIFSDGVDRLGSQAKTVLVTSLQQTGRFNVLDRDNLTEIRQEAGFANKAQAIKGADYVITGDVTEFGRKEVGDQQLFGILGRGKQQVAYAKVSLNVVNTATSEVIASSQGAGEYSPVEPRNHRLWRNGQLRLHPEREGARTCDARGGASSGRAGRRRFLEAIA